MKKSELRKLIRQCLSQSKLIKQETSIQSVQKRAINTFIAEINDYQFIQYLAHKCSNSSDITDQQCEQLNLGQVDELFMNIISQAFQMIKPENINIFND